MLRVLYTRFVSHALSTPHNLFARVAERFPIRFFKWYHALGSASSRPWQGHRGGFTLSFDCDYSTDTAAIPELLAILSGYSFKTAFACIGVLMEKAPDVYRQIVFEGHEIVNHTYAHPDNREFNPDRKFNQLTVEEQEEEIRRCHAVCRDLLGCEPIGFRIPHFGRLFDPRVYGELERLGYRYSSSILSARAPGYGVPYTADHGIIEFPISVCPAHPLNCCFDTSHLFRNPGSQWSHSQDEFVSLFALMIDVAVRYGTYINLYFDPADIVVIDRFREALDLLEARREEIWVATYRQLLDA